MSMYNKLHFFKVPGFIIPHPLLMCTKLLQFRHDLPCPNFILPATKLNNMLLLIYVNILYMVILHFTLCSHLKILNCIGLESFQ